MSKNSRRGVYFSLRLWFVKFLWKSLPALAAGLGDGTGVAFNFIQISGLDFNHINLLINLIKFSSFVGV